jgi:hypothetical protein
MEGKYMKKKISLFTLMLVATLILSTIIFAVAPTVSDFTKTGVKNTPVAFTADDFTNNYTDTNDPVLGLAKIQIVTLPSASSGTLKLDTTDITADQEIDEVDLSKISFVPTTDYTGDATFDWKGSNGTEYSDDTATVTITISESGAPTGPVANNGSFTIDKNTILSNSLSATAAEGETLTYIIVTNPAHGTLTHTDESSSSFTYSPLLDYVGDDSFTFKVNNGTEDSNVATVTITIEEPETPVIPFNYEDMQTHWANYSASHLAAMNKIIGEKIAGKYFFYPDRDMTRADFVLFLLAVTESEADANLEIPDVTFADSDTTPDWLEDLLKKAYAKGIIKGSAVGNQLYLNPFKKLTRVEASVMVSNALTLTDTNVDVTFNDKTLIPAWALQHIKNLKAYQIIQGNSDNSFRPNGIITRGEGAELSYKLLKELQKQALAVDDVK